MADRNVSMIVQVVGAVRNQYLRTMETVEQRQERLTGALTCVTNLGQVQRWQDMLFNAVASQCRFEYGTAQSMRYNLVLEIGRRKTIGWYTYYAPMVQRSYRKVGLRPVWLSRDTSASVRCRRSGTFRSLRKMFVEGDHDGWLYPHPGLMARTPIYLVC